MPIEEKPSSSRPEAAGNPTRTAGAPGPTAAPAPARVLRSEDLLAGGAEVTILHGQDAYRLRLTSKDKLILTK